MREAWRALTFAYQSMGRSEGRRLGLETPRTASRAASRPPPAPGDPRLATRLRGPNPAMPNSGAWCSPDPASRRARVGSEPGSAASPTALPGGSSFKERAAAGNHPRSRTSWRARPTVTGLPGPPRWSGFNPTPRFPGLQAPGPCRAERAPRGRPAQAASAVLRPHHPQAGLARCASRVSTVLPSPALRPFPP